MPLTGLTDRDLREVQQPSWAVYDELVKRCTATSTAGEQAARWSFTVLHETLGDDWLRRYIAVAQEPPPECSAAMVHQAAFANLLETALRLDQFRGFSGNRLVRNLRQNPNSGNWRHSLLQLEVAALARRWTPDFEAQTGGRGPVDVLLERSSSTIAVEVLTIGLDDRTLDGNSWSQAVRARLRSIESECRVVCRARLNAVMDVAATDELLEKVEAVAVRVGEGGAVEVVAVPGASVEVSTRDIEVGETSFRGPLLQRDESRRIVTRLRRKALRAAPGALPLWLRVDELAGLFQITQWATWELPRKLVNLQRLIQASLTAHNQVQGVILSSGAGQSFGPVVGESCRVDSSVGLRRQLPGGRARETFIISLTASRGEVADIVSWYDVEDDWLGQALAGAGLRPFPELWRS